MERPVERILAGILLIASMGTVAAGHMAARYGMWWPRRLFGARPTGIVIHHSASAAVEEGRPVDAALIDRWHERRGWGVDAGQSVFHIGYHYVVLPDGTVQPGRPEWMYGAHTRGHNDTLGICLIGNFSSSANPDMKLRPGAPTQAQLDALDALLRRLLRRYHLRVEDVHRHRDFAPTACPGDRFPFGQVIARLKGETR